MYPIITFPAVKVVEFKGSFMDETESCLKFYGKIGGIMLAFNAFSSIKKIIKDYDLKPNDFLSITAEIRPYTNKSGQQDESYMILSAIPIKGSEKAIWPTVYFPQLKVTALKQGDAKTGKYYYLSANDMQSHAGKYPVRNLYAWTGGMCETVEKMKLKTGSRIMAVAQARYEYGVNGKVIKYTLLSFSYLYNSDYEKKENAKEAQNNEPAVIEKIEEPIFDNDIIDMPEPKKERKPVKIEFNMNDFEAMFE